MADNTPFPKKGKFSDKAHARDVCRSILKELSASKRAQPPALRFWRTFMKVSALMIYFDAAQVHKPTLDLLRQKSAMIGRR